MVTFDISTRAKTVSVKSDEVDDEIGLIQRKYAASPSSRTTYVKTMKTENTPSDNQAVESITTTVQSPVSKQVVVKTTTSAAGDNQAEHMPLDEKAEHVENVTKTVASPGSEQLRTVRYVTTTAGSQAGSPVTIKTVAQPQQNAVMYTTGAANPQQNVVTYATGAAAAPQQNVRYVTKTVTPPGSVVHTLSPPHHTQYVTSSQPIPAQTNQQTNHQVWMVPQQVQYVARSPSEQQQKVQYVTRTITQPGTATIQTHPIPQSQVQYITTTKTSTGSDNGAVGVGPELATGSAAIATGSAAMMTVSSAAAPPSPAVQIKLVDGVEGLPPPHFIGVQRPAIDVASSDSEASDVELVFDIMTQTFKRVRRGIVTKCKAKVAGSGASSTGSFRSGTESGSGSRSTKSGSAAVVAAGAAGVALATGAATVAEGVSGSGATAIAATAIAATGSAACNAGAAPGSGSISIQGSAAATGSSDLVDGSDKTQTATAVAPAAAPRSSPMMKLDTVSTPTSAGKPPVSATPSGITKRMPSQTKQEPSPRRFFGTSPAPSTPGAGSNAANPAALNADVALNMEELAPYAALRSPSHNDSCESGAGPRLALLLKRRVCHWFTITFLVLAIVLIMVIFYKSI